MDSRRRLCMLCQILCILATASCGLAAEITTESGELVFGSSVMLRCSGDSGATIEWTGPDLSRTGITVGEQETSGSTPSRTLTFDAVLESHAGDYTCTETGSDSDSFTIPVVNDFSAELTTNFDMVVSNARLEFTCSLASPGDQSLLSFIPTGDVTYQITGPGGQVLGGVVINQVGPNDGGSYTCTATLLGSYLDTSGGSIDFTSAALDVVVYITGQLQFEQVGSPIYVGSSSSLGCFATFAIPAGTTGTERTGKWTFDGQLLNAPTGFNPTSRIYISESPLSVVLTFITQVVFQTVHSTDGGTYGCEVTIGLKLPSAFVVGTNFSESMEMNVVAPPLGLSVDTSLVRLPPLPPYNTFLLTCSEALPSTVHSFLQVQFTWQRSKDTGGFSNLTVPEGINTDVGGATILRTDGDGFSILNVTETVSGDYTYRCSGVLTIPDDTTYTDDAEILVNITSPKPPVRPDDVNTTAVDHKSATVQWTVVLITYTPETYVVLYGTASGVLSETSQVVDPMGRLDDEKQVYTVELTGLTRSTDYYYRVVAINSIGNTSSEELMFRTFYFPDPPQVTVHPVDQTNIVPGSDVSFSVTATSTAPLSYQWQKDGVDLTDGGSITGATTATLTITGVMESDEGGYRCVVTNIAGMVTSITAMLTLVNPPQVTVHPVDQSSIIPGSTVMFSVTATGTEPLSYSWQKDGVALADGRTTEGVNKSTLTIFKVFEGDEGSYLCVVSNIAGTATSNAALLILDREVCMSCTGAIVGVFFSEFAFFLVALVAAVLITYYVTKKRIETYSVKDSQVIDIALKECPAYEETKVQVYEEVDVARPRDENPYDN